jgi:hypothetical protein
MSFETISLLLNWLEIGALLAILFRLSSTFQLIASTQRELRRAIHHLAERRADELVINNALNGPSNAFASSSPHAPAHTERTIRPHHLGRLSPGLNP